MYDLISSSIFYFKKFIKLKICLYFIYRNPFNSLIYFHFNSLLVNSLKIMLKIKMQIKIFLNFYIVSNKYIYICNL